MKVIKAMSDYVIVLKNGKIIEEGTANPLFKIPKNKYTQKYINARIKLINTW